MHGHSIFFTVNIPVLKCEVRNRYYVYSEVVIASSWLPNNLRKLIMICEVIGILR